MKSQDLGLSSQEKLIMCKKSGKVRKNDYNLRKSQDFTDKQDKLNNYIPLWRQTLSEYAISPHENWPF